jgi:hypothetical protein
VKISVRIGGLGRFNLSRRLAALEAAARAALPSLAAGLRGRPGEPSSAAPAGDITPDQQE